MKLYSIFAFLLLAGKLLAIPELWYEAEDLKVKETKGGRIEYQGFHGVSQGKHLWWVGPKQGDTITLEFEVKRTGKYKIGIQYLGNNDYGKLQFLIDGQKVGAIVDQYHTEIITRRLMTQHPFKLKKGTHTLTIKHLGKNKKNTSNAAYGSLDVLRLVPAK